MIKSDVFKIALAMAFIGATTNNVYATVIETTIKGSDAIWLAGRTDLTIPDASAAWPGGMLRHGGNTPEEIKETMPTGFAVTSGDVIQVLDPASGGVSFFNGFGSPVFGPEGNGDPNSSNITSFGGISSYIGTQGALVGVFLSNDIPDGTAPVGLDFSNSGIGVDFSSLSPEIGQVFFIGNGLTLGNVFQQFIAPTAATRLFLGVPDAFDFTGVPGAYDDNDGSYRIKLGINEDPRNPVTNVPEPTTLALLGLGLLGLGLLRRSAR